MRVIKEQIEVEVFDAYGNSHTKPYSIIYEQELEGDKHENWYGRPLIMTTDMPNIGYDPKTDLRTALDAKFGVNGYDISEPFTLENQPSPLKELFTLLNPTI